MDNHNIKLKINYRQVLEENACRKASKQTNKQTNDMRIGNNDITQNIRVLTNIINNFRLMSIHVIQRNGSDCRYIEICTDCFCSAGAQSRTVFSRGANTKQWEVPEFAGRNASTDILQKGILR
jgi:hypothetical protein